MNQYTNNDVTIIIPVYNGERYIKHSMLSCLNQTEDIIVINDGSIDKTKSIIESIGNGITVINLDKNYGTAKALNTGIRLSDTRTNFIKWLSADDILKPNAIKNMIELVNQHCNIDNRIFYTHYDIINANRSYVKTFNEPFIKRENQNSILLDRFYGNGSTSLIHKDIFNKVGLFNESLGYQEDYEFWLRASCLHDVRLTLLPLNTIYYRVHDKQLTAIHKGESLKQSDMVREIIYKQKPELRLLPKPSLPIKQKLKRLVRNTIYR